MKETILGCVSVGFLGLGFVFAERPFLSIICFLIFVLLGMVCISLEDKKRGRCFANEL